MKLSQRLCKIKERLFEQEFKTAKKWNFIGETILTSEEIISEPLVIRKAMAIEYVAEHLPVIIKNDELIIGNPSYGSAGMGTTLPNYATDEELKKAKFHMLDENSLWGHHPPDWEKLLKMGVNGVKAEIEGKLEEEYLRGDPDREVINEYRAMIISLDAVLKFAHRHAEYALKCSIEEKDPIRRRELYEIYKVCSRVPAEPAQTYQEALQSCWFLYAMLTSMGEYMPLARSDQYLYPYIEKDLEEHRITRENAIDLTGSFLAKFNERVMLNLREIEPKVTFGMFSLGAPNAEEEQEKGDDVGTGTFVARMRKWQDNEDINSDTNFSYGQSGNGWNLNMILGGVKPDGTEGVNELTYLLIDLMSEMKLLVPTLSVRMHKDAPPEILTKVASVLRYGQGEPAVYNDDLIIPGLVEMGIPLEDARNYSNDGCWEPLIPGKTYFTYAHIPNLQCLEWTLHNGISNVSGNKEGLETGDPVEFKDWEEFYAAYKKQMFDRFDFHVERRLENLTMTSMIAPDPLLSCFMHDCVETGKDLTNGGMRYYMMTMLATGLSNAVNGLAAVKKLVYDDKTVTMQEMVDATKNNWKGYEDLHMRIKNEVPKFGNDHEYVDDIAVRLMADFEERMLYWRHKQDKLHLACGIGTFENYAVLGRPIGATPDGRMATDELASNYSPVAGSDVEGPLAVFKSITRPELANYFGGCPVDISINASEFEGDAGLQRLEGVIRTFMRLGGQILTITSQNVEELKEAMKNPDKYQSLRVRMGGYSAYFVAMAPKQQQVIISRFEKGK